MDDEKKPVVGIDLGTTCSCIFRWNGREPEIYVNRNGDQVTPSVVYIGEKETLVGRVAVSKGGIRPERHICKIKRKMGDSTYCLSIDNNDYTPEDISSIVLKKLKDDVISKYPSSIGFDIAGAVVTVPYYFKAPERSATLEAAKKAGLNVLGLMNEPTAAALYCGWKEFIERKESPPENILVFDLGGGTFDVTVFKVINTKERLTFEVLSTGGDSRLGGTDFDEAIEDYVLKKSGLSLDELEEKEKNRAQMLLNNSVVAAKQDLSSVSTAYIGIPNFIRDQHLDLELTKTEFEKIIEQYLDRIRGIVEDTYFKSGLNPGQLDRVIKIGGSSKIPIMDEVIEEATGCQPYGNFNVDLAVAAGAALYASILDNRVAFQKEIVVKEIVSHALGIKTGTNTFTKLIPESRRTPCEVSQIFSTLKDGATSVDIEVYQGRGSTVDSKEVTQIGYVPITGLLPQKKGTLDIKITFKVNNDQNISVVVEQEESGIYLVENLKMC